MKLNCKDCTKRKVGCHSTCQPYIVQRVITLYKNEKALQEFEHTFNPRTYDLGAERLKNKLKG